MKSVQDYVISLPGHVSRKGECNGDGRMTGEREKGRILEKNIRAKKRSKKREIVRGEDGEEDREERNNSTYDVLSESKLIGNRIWIFNSTPYYVVFLPLSLTSWPNKLQ